MTEGLIRHLGGKKYTFSLLMLATVVFVRGMGWIDGSQFMTGFLALGGGFLGVTYAADKAAKAGKE
jgi:hypothetical protein